MYHTTAMRFRWVTLLVATYLALDFATPMLPGAVQLVDGSLEVVAGCPARSAEKPVPAVTALARQPSTFRSQPRLSVPAARMISASAPVPVLFRAPLEFRSTPASSSDDD